jgi:hypothetical protein
VKTANSCHFLNRSERHTQRHPNGRAAVPAGAAVTGLSSIDSANVTDITISDEFFGRKSGTAFTQKPSPESSAMFSNLFMVQAEGPRPCQSNQSPAVRSPAKRAIRQPSDSVGAQLHQLGVRILLCKAGRMVCFVRIKTWTAAAHVGAKPENVDLSR